MAITYKEYQCKSMLRMHKYVDNWFWSSGTVSPYRACEHACNYCDGRSKKYHASEDFDKVVYVKINALDMLRKELNKMFPTQKTLAYFDQGKDKKERKMKPMIAVSSGISDAYQPAEKRYKLTRKILMMLRDYEVPTYIMTKSDLVLRDLDVIKEIDKRAWCNVSFSVSTLDRTISKLFEPKATPPKKRLEAMRKISQEGILTGITYIPIIPFMADSKEHIEDTIRSSKKCGARYILAGTMTMRDLQAERFYETVEEHFPDLVKKYKTLYQKGYEPDGKYIAQLFDKVKAACKKYDIKNYIPRYIPDIELKKNIETSTMLFLMAYFLSLSGENRYKQMHYLRTAQIIENMSENIEDIYKAGKLGEIKGMGKKSREYLEEFLKTGKCKYLEDLMW